MKRGQRSLKKRSELAERREYAWALVKRGRTLQEVADELGYSKSSAQRDVQHVLAEVAERTIQDAMQQRVLDVARVEDVISSWYPAAAGLVLEADDAPDDAPEVIEVTAVDGNGVPVALRLVRVEPDRDAAEVFLKAVDQKGKMLGYYRQEVALVAQTPLVVASTDLSGLGEAELDAVIRNLQAALGAGHD